MRRLIAPAAVFAALVLAGCSATAVPDAEPSPTETPSAAPVESPSPEPSVDSAALEQGFLDTVRQEVGGDLATYPDDGLIDVGNSVCESLRVDVAPAEIQTALTDAGFSESASVNVIIGAGVLLCSDQGEKVVNGW